MVENLRYHELKHGTDSACLSDAEKQQNVSLSILFEAYIFHFCLHKRPISYLYLTLSYKKRVKYNGFSLPKYIPLKLTSTGIANFIGNLDD